jgi:hypothetical protein
MTVSARRRPGASQVSQQPCAHAELVQIGAAGALADEGEDVAPPQRVPAQLVGQLQRAQCHRAQPADRPRLRFTAQSREFARGHRIGARRLQLRQEHRRLPDEVLLCHPDHRPSGEQNNTAILRPRRQSGQTQQRRPYDRGYAPGRPEGTSLDAPVRGAAERSREETGVEW